MKLVLIRVIIEEKKVINIALKSKIDHLFKKYFFNTRFTCYRTERVLFLLLTKKIIVFVVRNNCSIKC